MATTNSLTNALTQKTSTSSQSNSKDRLQDLNVDQFLKLMIAELQNQDPLNPMDNAQMIQQIGEIRAVAATDKLSSTLTSVQLGQALASASSLIGKTIDGLADDQSDVKGKVDRVTVVDGVPKLHIGAASLDLTNVREILPASTN